MSASENAPDPARYGLEGRVAIVTGGARGIGREIADGFAGLGVKVLVADLDGAAADRAAQEIEQAGGTARGVAVDVTRLAGAERMAQAAVDAWGRLDILVNNAAIANNEPIELMEEQAWRDVVDVNLTGPFLCARAVLPHMFAARYGKIVNVSSVAAKRISYNASAAYTASKAGLLAFTRHLAYEVAGRGVNVNAICPGPTLTPMLTTMATPETLEARRRSVPRGRMATPQDHLEAILYLVSDASQMICGQAIDVDGGALLGWYDTDLYFKRRGGGA